MAFWTNWAQKVGSEFVGKWVPSIGGVLLRKSDDSSEMLKGNGSGAAMVDLGGSTLPLPTGAATEATLEDILSQLSGSETAWQEVHGWTGSGADTEPPTVWIPLTGGPANYLQWKYAFSSFGGTVAPTQCTIRIWARTGTFVRKLWERVYDTATLVVADASTPLYSLISPFSADECAITCTFVDGTSPTATGKAYVRGLHAAGLQRSDLDYSSDGRTPVLQSKAYDSTTSADKVLPQHDLSDYSGNLLTTDLSGTSVVTQNHDIVIATTSDVGIVVSGKSDAANTVKVAVQVCCDPASAVPTYANVTASVVDATNNVALAPDSSGDVVIPIGGSVTTTYWVLERVPAGVLRLRVTVGVADADNALKMAVYGKFGG